MSANETKQSGDGRGMTLKTDPRTMQFKSILEGDKFQRALTQTLPKTIRAERMIRVVLAAFQQSPKLLECTPESVLLSIMRAAAMGLEPDGGALGHGYLVPFWNGKKRCSECQFIPGYRGLVKLARNSGEIADVWAEVVYEADDFNYELGLEQTLKHKRNDNVADPGAMRYAYAVARFRDGERKFVVLNRREVESIKKRSASKDRDGNTVGPWVTDEPEMWKKTAVRRLAKLLPLSVEAAVTISDSDDAERSVVSAAVPHVDLLALESPREESDQVPVATDELTAAQQQPPRDQTAVTSEGTADTEPTAIDSSAFAGCSSMTEISIREEKLAATCEDADSRQAVADAANSARNRIRASRGSRSNGAKSEGAVA